MVLKLVFAVDSLGFGKTLPSEHARKREFTFQVLLVRVDVVTVFYLLPKESSKMPRQSKGPHGTWSNYLLTTETGSTTTEAQKRQRMTQKAFKVKFYQL